MPDLDLIEGAGETSLLKVLLEDRKLSSFDFKVSKASFILLSIPRLLFSSSRLDEKSLL
jgi:hypothetical protein